jgi:hypothetical protein
MERIKQMITREEIHDRIQKCTGDTDWNIATMLQILEALSDKLAGIEERQADYNDLFRIAVHTHVNNQKDDTCAKCGLDLRHIVHRRA